MAKGFDTTETLTDASLAAVKEAGYTFVARYINGGWKQMYPAEARRISAAGLYIVSLYQEYNNEASRFSYEIGVGQAERALALAAELGQPKNTPIYFAVDFDASYIEVRNDIVPFFKGVKSLFLNAERNPHGYCIGIYGSNLVCNYIKGVYTDRYTMVASAAYDWTGNKDYPLGDWNLQQTAVNLVFERPGVSLEIDACESSVLGGGGWRL